MAQVSVQTTSVLDVATEFARAYAEGDYARVRELVAPDVLQREIAPRGLRRDGEPVLCDFYELFQVGDDVITQIDLVCSGVVTES